MTVLALALAALFLFAGVAHAIAPRYFVGLVPAWLPSPRTIVAASGVADVLVAVLLALPATRQTGGALASGLLAVYQVSHLDAFRHRDASGPLLMRPWMTLLRIAVNLGYMLATLAVAIAG